MKEPPYVSVVYFSPRNWSEALPNSSSLRESYVVLVYAMQAYTAEGGGEGRAPLIFNFGTKCEWSVSSTGRVTPGVRYPDTH